jgi:HD-like signal output (HDOD) protein
MSKNDKHTSGSKTDSSGDTEQGQLASGATGPLSILFPADIDVWFEARRLAAEPNMRVEELAICCSQDPVIVIELLRLSNAMFFTADRSAITTAKSAIIRLGSEVIIDTLERLKERTELPSENLQKHLDIQRSKCRRASIVARIISEAIAKNLSDDCQTAGLFMYLGDMLAVMHLRETYAALAQESSSATLAYKLSNKLNFDTENMRLNYLRRGGMPEALLFAIDREGSSRMKERAIMKPICFSAYEMIEAFDGNRWDKLAPGKTIPPKSAIRMLQMSDSQYLKVYERASEYLFSARLLEERKNKEPRRSRAMLEAEFSQSQDITPKKTGELENEIELLLGSIDKSESEDLTKPDVSKSAPGVLEESKILSKDKVNLKGVSDSFRLESQSAKRKSAPRVNQSLPKKDIENSLSSSAQKVLGSFTKAIEEADSSEDLLTNLLKMLVDNGPFEQSALIVVADNKQSAIVVAARGNIFSSGQKIAIEDPLSPLAQCFSKIQSFGNKKSDVSPFGSKAFALAPIDADHETPVALYADCGQDGSLSFEARRIFRIVVELLNRRLPSLPGGIPVELDA